jgi:hypothetical protein
MGLQLPHRLGFSNPNTNFSTGPSARISQEPLILDAKVTNRLIRPSHIGTARNYVSIAAWSTLSMKSGIRHAFFLYFKTALKTNNAAASVERLYSLTSIYSLSVSRPQFDMPTGSNQTPANANKKEALAYIPKAKAKEKKRSHLISNSALFHKHRLLHQKGKRPCKHDHSSFESH